MGSGQDLEPGMPVRSGTTVLSHLFIMTFFKTLKKEDEGEEVMERMIRSRVVRSAVVQYVKSADHMAKSLT